MRMLLLILCALALSKLCLAMEDAHRFRRVNQETGNLETAFRDYLNEDKNIRISCIPQMHIAVEELYRETNKIRWCLEIVDIIHLAQIHTY